MPSSISDDELLKTFRGIGEASIRNLILTYFKKELNSPELGLHSRVFPRFPNKFRHGNRKTILLNRLLVRKCLHENWSGIQESYPCIDDFKYVVGDADLMYTMRFPFVDLTTYETYGVETVRDFVDFIFEFVQSLCIPCLYLSDKSCHVVRQEMIEALEKCKTVECTDTRMSLLSFFIDHVETSDAYSSTKLSMAPRGKTSQVDTGRENMVCLNGQCARRPLLHTLVDDYHDLGEEIKSELQEEYGDFVQPYINNDYPESEGYLRSKNSMAKWEKSDEEMSPYTKWKIAANVVESDGEEFDISFDENGHVTLNYILLPDGQTKFISRAAKEDYESDLNNILDDIDKRSLTLLAHVKQADKNNKTPFSMTTVCGMENGKWKAKLFVYVFSDKMTVSGLDEITSLLTNEDSEGVPLKSFYESSEPNIKFAPDFGNVKHAEGKPYSYEDDPDRVDKLMVSLLGTPFDISPDLPNAKMIEIAETLRISIYGNDTNSLSADRFLGAIYLGKTMVDNEPSKLKDAIKMFTEHMNKRIHLLHIDARNNLELALLRVKDVASMIDAPFDDNFIGPIRDMEPDVQEYIWKSLLEYLSSFGHKGLEEVAEKDVKGWADFKNGLREGKRSAVDAVDNADLMIKEGSSSLGYYGMFMRKVHHGLFEKTPLNAKLLSVLGSYFKMESTIDSPKDADLFTKRVKAILYGAFIEDISGLTYGDVIRLATDTTFAAQWYAPRWVQEDWGALIKPVEREALNQAATFILLYLVISIFIFVARKKLPVNEAGVVDAEWEENYKKGRHALILLLGWWEERMDLSVVHVMLTAMIHGPQLTSLAAGTASRKVKSWFKQKEHVEKELTPEEKKQNEKADNLLIKPRPKGRSNKGLGNPSQTRSGTKF